MNIPLRAKIMGYALLEGMLVMSNELCAGHFIASRCGNSIQIWSSVLCITLLGLSLGYFDAARGKAERSWGRLRLLLFAGAFIPILGMELVQKLDVAPFASALLNAWFLATILLLPVMFCLGQILPQLAHQDAIQAEYPSYGPGKLFAVSTLGGILSAYLIGFVLLPVWGPILPFWGFALPIGCAYVWGLDAWRRRLIALGSISAGLLLLYIAPRPPAILADGHSLLGRVSVVDDALAHTRTLYFNGLPQTVIGTRDSCSQLAYVQQVAVLASSYPAGSRSLVLGVGGGTAVNALLELGHSVDGCEIDPLVLDFAEQYFGMRRPETNIVADDARHYLHGLRDVYNFILLDCFFGDSPPWHVLTVEAMRKLHAHLHTEGMLLVFFPASVDKAPMEMMQQSLLAAGFELAMLGGNEGLNAGQLCIATHQPFDYTRYTPFKATACATGMPLRFPFKQIPKSAEPKAVFTDDLPVLEAMSRPSNIRRGWEK